jgi:hypothetical protein
MYFFTVLLAHELSSAHIPTAQTPNALICRIECAHRRASYRRLFGSPVTRSRVGWENIPVDAALAGLLGTAVGAVAGLAGGVLTGWQQRRAELQRWRAARLDESRQEKLRELQLLTTVMAKAAHEITFMAWSASAKSVDLVRADAASYEDSMRSLLPEIFTAQANAFGLSHSVFEELRALVRKLLDMDGDIGSGIVQLETTPEDAQRHLAAVLERARGLEIEVVDQVWDAIRRERLVDDDNARRQP